MEIQIQDTMDIKPKSKFVPKKESDRYDKETGKYDHSPLDPEYYKMYWRCKMNIFLVNTVGNQWQS